MYWNDGHMDDGWGFAMMLGVLGLATVLIAAVVFAIVWGVRQTAAPPGATAAPATGSGEITASAAQILAERLARGEIDTEEYRTRLDALKS